MPPAGRCSGKTWKDAVPFKIPLSGLAGLFVFLQGKQPGGRSPWVRISASSLCPPTSFKRCQGTVMCAVELGVSRACVCKPVCERVGDGDGRWGAVGFFFFNLHFSNSFLLCSPKRRHTEWSKHLTFVKCWWSGPDGRGDVGWHAGGRSEQGPGHISFSLGS